MNRRHVLLGGGGAVVVAGVAATGLAIHRMGSMETYDASIAVSRAALSATPDAAGFIRFATLAANSHNTQPWRFRVRDVGIDILPDLSRRTPAVDPDDHHLFASLGCAAENLALAAGAAGRVGDLRFDPSGDGTISLTLRQGYSPPSPLFEAIRSRQSTRAEYDGRPVPVADLKSLVEAAAVPGVDLVLLTDRARIDRVRDMIVAGNTAQLQDVAFVRELKSWLRFNPRQALATGDGLFSIASGNPALPSWLGPRMFDLVFNAQAENDKYSRHLRSSAGIAVFVGEKDDRDHWVRAGRASQRFALQATALGLKHAMVNQPVEVARLRPELAALVGLQGRRPNIVMRFGFGPRLPFSARRPVEAVLA